MLWWLPARLAIRSTIMKLSTWFLQLNKCLPGHMAYPDKCLPGQTAPGQLRTLTLSHGLFVGASHVSVSEKIFRRVSVLALLIILSVSTFLISELLITTLIVIYHYARPFYNPACKSNFSKLHGRNCILL